MNPRKKLNSEKYVESASAFSMYFLGYLTISFFFPSVLQENQQKSPDKYWAPLQKSLGMIANNPNVTMAERMAFSCHSNPSSHITYIQTGHNSDFSFQKAVSGALLRKKKEILKKEFMVKK
jgi:hypothetical protein